MNKSEEDVIYLCAYALGGLTADLTKIQNMDLDQVYQISMFHKISGVVSAAVIASGVKKDCFIQASAAGIRRAILFQSAWETVRVELEKAGIWYMLLKGSVMQDYYPSFGMREMTDYDVLVDSTRMKDIKGIMEGLGYRFLSYDEYNHDIYIKPPILNFEMHRALFADYDGDNLHRYYTQIEEKMIRRNQYEYILKPEDLYIYLIAHDYKHFYDEGMGLRPLLDVYLFLKKEHLDFDYIDSETGKMEIRDFEHMIRAISFHLMEGGELSPDEEKCLEYILFSGHYGNYDQHISNMIRKKKRGKIGYMLSRFAVPFSPKNSDYSVFAKKYPLFYRHPILLPLLPFYRVIRSIRRGYFVREAKAIRSTK